MEPPDALRPAHRAALRRCERRERDRERLLLRLSSSSIPTEARDDCVDGVDREPLDLGGRRGIQNDARQQPRNPRGAHRRREVLVVRRDVGAEHDGVHEQLVVDAHLERPARYVQHPLVDEVFRERMRRDRREPAHRRDEGGALGRGAVGRRVDPRDTRDDRDDDVHCCELLRYECRTALDEREVGECAEDPRQHGGGRVG
mmetsp:Transcript_2390/g.9168  ORF Transcript_2390/g.9168 Transcript_2390/m.9168 type:complete len:201 (-) Transcript_2390:103-705(-)